MDTTLQHIAHIFEQVCKRNKKNSSKSLNFLLIKTMPEFGCWVSFRLFPHILAIFLVKSACVYCLLGLRSFVSYLAFGLSLRRALPCLSLTKVQWVDNDLIETLPHIFHIVPFSFLVNFYTIFQFVFIQLHANFASHSVYMYFFQGLKYVFRLRSNSFFFS